MAIRTIRLQGDPVLTKVCRPITEVTERIRILAEDMVETMYEANGVGLAAPQVGILKRLVVIDVRLDGWDVLGHQLSLHLQREKISQTGH